ncbi:plasmid mobilization protein [Phyllobacterium endophyticum]|uniref:plasmid mobilization protein n=1 Tax=Phyllobacterium endophyticum TaxID=1149773 RepID=UPI0011C7984B|nr:plasmid mobilization relaxosome protein MobC [Phyllobacterium endophyticum]TXR49504.1 plasmid mobilization relaxosome protein MobC [Phyllobacterium endophyticum]
MHLPANDRRRKRRDKVVHARFSRSEIEQIEHAAEDAGMTVSGFLRSLSLEGAGVRPFFSDADRAVLFLLLSDIKAVGVNLNQLARARNRGETGQLLEEKRTIDDVQRVVAVVLFELQASAERGARRHAGSV